MMPGSKRKSAFSAALQEAQQHGDTVLPQEGETVTTPHSETVTTPHGETVVPLDSIPATQYHSLPVSPSHSETVQSEQQIELSPSHGDTVKPSKDQFSRKVSFYLTREQEKKLDDLADDYRRQHEGKRINRNDIVRYLIDHCTLKTLETLEG
jgi:hypothetical protein